MSVPPSSTGSNALRRLALKGLSVPLINRGAEALLSPLRRVMAQSLALVDKIQRNLPQAARLEAESSASTEASAKKHLSNLCEMAEKWPIKPNFGWVIYCGQTDPGSLKNTLSSLSDQNYPTWRVLLIHPRKLDEATERILRDFRGPHGQTVDVLVHESLEAHEAGDSTATALDSWLSRHRIDYWSIFDSGDLWSAAALLEVVRHINLRQEPDALYTDEGEFRKPESALYKPDWSPLFQLSRIYVGKSVFFKQASVQKSGGWASFAPQSSFSAELVAARMILQISRLQGCKMAHLAGALFRSPSTPNRNSLANLYREAVLPYFTARGVPCELRFVDVAANPRVQLGATVPAPLISIVIPSKDSPALIERCIDTIFSKTTYRHIEVIVSDNGSTDARTLAAYQRWAQQFSGRFQALIEPAPFNFGAQINRGVRAARGDFVLLLNNDTEIETPEWIDEMLPLAQLPEVGAVGAKLLFKDRLIQHAGIALTPNGIAEYYGFLQPEDHQGHLDHCCSVREVSAVTAACLLVAKSKFTQVGGMDELFLPRGYGDIAFCLELRKLGLSNVFTPHAVLIHNESSSRGLVYEQFERQLIRERYGQQLMTDPYLNPNLQRNPRHVRDSYFQGTAIESFCTLD